MVFNYNNPVELLRKVKMCLITWWAYVAGKGPWQDTSVSKVEVWRKSFVLWQVFGGERAAQNKETFQTLQEADTSLEGECYEFFLSWDISIISRQIVLNLILEPLRYWSPAATGKVIWSILYLWQSALLLFHLKKPLLWFASSLSPCLSDPSGDSTPHRRRGNTTQKLQYFLPPSRWCHGLSLG